MAKSITGQINGFFREVAGDFKWCGDVAISELVERHLWDTEIEPAVVDMLGLAEGSCIDIDVDVATLDDLVKMVEDRLTN